MTARLTALVLAIYLAGVIGLGTSGWVLQWAG